MADQQVTLEQLAADIRYLRDRQEIRDCVNRYARGVDRHDEKITASAYHADAIDEHGVNVNDVAGFPAWVNAQHAAATFMHTHNITTHNCEIDGDVAHAETYVICGLSSLDQKNVSIGGGRYIDRLERRDGEWRIVLRRTMMDWLLRGDGTAFLGEWHRGQAYPQGVRSEDDLSYMRPLELDAEGLKRLEAMLASRASE